MTRIHSICFRRVPIATEAIAVLQESKPELLPTVRETLALFAAFYPSPRPVQEIAEVLGVPEQLNTQVASPSGDHDGRLDN